MFLSYQGARGNSRRASLFLPTYHHAGAPNLLLLAASARRGGEISDQLELDQSFLMREFNAAFQAVRRKD